ncbi:unnamed protein product [Moneuplotes crassus]|uniref:Uncharacterized protein n=1 Tax=Euplotes crassus TaxID=5936 RepID=A0AAD1Y0P3_EUPCR|nr:unnamed protein product [Moneuplotes crassus]
MESSSVPSSIQDSSKGVLITVHAKPNSKNDSIIEIDDECVNLSITAPPKDGKANGNICEFLAETLGIKKRQVEIAKGGKSKNKVAIINADTGLTAEEVYELLKEEI